MASALEDQYEDILSKACSGFGIGKRDMAQRAGVDEEALQKAFRGECEEATARAVARVLNLDSASLIRIGIGQYAPKVEPPSNLRQVTTPHPVPGYEEMTVNAYLAWDATSKQAVAFDSGADAGPLLEIIGTEGLTLTRVLLTHAHGDHIADLARLLEGTGNPPVHINSRESAPGAQPFEPGATFEAGALKIASHETSGHSPGGTTFVVEGLARPVAIVGDALFAGSMGGAASAWEQALSHNRERIFSLPDETILCPGHGPMTTVAQEKANNPFYPEYK
jgi:glyoxylase-like metal-dependent hydrolase (beta-lactamase superfamily II)